LWLAVSLLLSTIVGTAAGVLAWLGGAHPPTALIQGGAAFAATTILALLTISFLSTSHGAGETDRSR
jgi:hypothetical protein